MLELEPARKELAEKTLLDIERATALTWGARAAVSFEFAVQAATDRERLRWLQDGENYRQEAIEHGAMTEDLEFLAELIKELDTHRKPALAAAA